LNHFHETMFNGFDFDNTMLRIASMNMLLHGVENPNIVYKDSLSEDHSAEEERYTLILANPPFAGSLDHESCANDLLQIVKTKKTELLFVALFLRLLKPGGRAGIVVPDGVLFGSSNAHRNLRRNLVDNHKLEAVISMPPGVFKPYSGVSTAVLIFTKTNAGGTSNVWFYDMQADGFSLDDKRLQLNGAEHENNNIPDVVERWRNLSDELSRPRTDQSFFVPVKEIEDANYDLSISRFKQKVHEAVSFEPPEQLLAQIRLLETHISEKLDELGALL
jgi:type I restriction enzyme M protein